MVKGLSGVQYSVFNGQGVQHQGVFSDKNKRAHAQNASFVIGYLVIGHFSRARSNLVNIGCAKNQSDSRT